MGKCTSSTAVDKAGVIAEARAYKNREKIPLMVHASGTWGRWARKINGKLVYFGQVIPGAKDYGASKALAIFNGQRVDLEAGRTPRPTAAGVTIADICDEFLLAKDESLARGEIVKRTRIDYERTTDRIVGCFGAERLVDDLRTEDFALLRKQLGKTLGPVALGNEIQRVRTVFRYAFESEWMDKPMRFGPGFKRPSKKVIRQQRNRMGAKVFTAEEIRLLLDAAGVQMRAMIMLGINCGYGNSDLGVLPRKAVNLATGWVDYPRPKTAIPRRCWIPPGSRRG